MKKTAGVKNIDKAFEVSLSGMRKIASDFRAEMERGLAGKKSSLKMIHSFAHKPSGDEKGSFIALDLGGTNFRILEVALKGAGRISMSDAMKFKIDSRHMAGKGEELFDFISRCLKSFLKKNRELGESRKLGFTFSFPVRQTGIDSGSLVCWTKGFKASGIVGKDVVLLLEESLERNGIENVKVSALVNDTVGTLEARGYSDRYCDIGVIIGTGTNACYCEPALGGMIVNIEWGNFDKIRTTFFDKFLDASSDSPGAQILEKTISGMYMGRLASAVLRSGLFPRMRDLETEEMSAIEADSSKGYLRTKNILIGAGANVKTSEEIAACRRTCSVISLRASRFAAACLFAIVTRMDPEVSSKHSIAIDGSVYEKHPVFKNNMNAALKELFGKRASNIRTVLAKDGSGVGAAITAATGA
jgi:hexokinase